MRNKNSGFTLLELLVTAAIVAIVSAAILSVFSAGINIYDRLRSYSDIRQDTLISLERIEKDLRGVCNISEIGFKGENTQITFPALVNNAPGSISYYIDKNTHFLVREERDYSAAAAVEPGKGAVTGQVFAASLKFSYYYYDPKVKVYLWADTWAKEPDEDKIDKSKKSKIKANTPLGVRMTVGYEDRGKTAALDRMIFFPLAVSLRFAEAASQKEEKGKEVKGVEKKG